MSFRRPSPPEKGLVVLGCRVRLDDEGRLLEGVLLRRVRAAAHAYASEQAVSRIGGGPPPPFVVASGGRRWGAFVEADVMARELALHGVPAEAIVRERLSMSTRENARFVAASLGRRGIREARLVTSEWHLPRALMLFRRAGLDVVGLPVRDPRSRWSGRVWRWGKEHTLRCIQSALEV